MTVGSQGQADAVHQSLEFITIPEELGTVQAQHRGDAGQPWIVYIQDAHAVVDAQQHIRQILEYLHKQYAFGLVAVEGARDRLDPLLVATFPDEYVKKKVLDRYLSRAELSGAALASAQGGEAPGYFGIEDWDLYEANYAAYLSGIGAREKVLDKTSEVTSALDRERLLVYGAEHNEFHEKASAFLRETSSLADFAAFLASREKLRNLADRYPELSKLIAGLESETVTGDKGLDIAVRQMAESFRKKYLPMLDRDRAMAFARDEQLYRTGQMDASSYLGTLVEAGKSLGLKSRLTPLMKKALGIREMLTHIKGTRLFDEIDDYIRAAQNLWEEGVPAERIAGDYRRLWLLENLARMELSRDQLEAYQKDPESVMALLGDARELAVPALEFYRLAMERDTAFHEALQKLLISEATNRAAVITGGFHAKGFEELLKKSGYSYAVVMPKIGSLEGQEYYEDVMKGKLSYDRKSNESLYDAFARDCTEKLVAQLDAPAFKKTLKLWRDNILRGLAAEGRLAEAADYTRYIDRLVRVFYERHGAAYTDNPLAETLNAVRREVERFRNEKAAAFVEKIKARVSVAAGQLGILRQKGAVTRDDVTEILRQSGFSVLAPSVSMPFARHENRVLNDFENGTLPPLAVQKSDRVLATRQEIRNVLDDLAAPAGADLAARREIRSAAAELAQLGAVGDGLGREIAAPGPELREQIQARVEALAGQIARGSDTSESLALKAQVAGALVQLMDRETSPSPASLIAPPSMPRGSLAPSDSAERSRGEFRAGQKFEDDGYVRELQSQPNWQVNDETFLKDLESERAKRRSAGIPENRVSVFEEQMTVGDMEGRVFDLYADGFHRVLVLFDRGRRIVAMGERSQMPSLLNTGQTFLEVTDAVFRDAILRALGDYASDRFEVGASREELQVSIPFAYERSFDSYAFAQAHPVLTPMLEMAGSAREPFSLNPGGAKIFTVSKFGGMMEGNVLMIGRREIQEREAEILGHELAHHLWKFALSAKQREMWMQYVRTSPVLKALYGELKSSIYGKSLRPDAIFDETFAYVLGTLASDHDWQVPRNSEIGGTYPLTELDYGVLEQILPTLRQVREQIQEQMRRKQEDGANRVTATPGEMVRPSGLTYQRERITPPAGQKAKGKGSGMGASSDSPGGRSWIDDVVRKIREDQEKMKQYERDAKRAQKQRDEEFQEMMAGFLARQTERLNQTMAKLNADIAPLPDKTPWLKRLVKWARGILQRTEDSASPPQPGPAPNTERREMRDEVAHFDEILEGLDWEAQVRWMVSRLTVSGQPLNFFNFDAKTVETQIALQRRLAYLCSLRLFDMTQDPERGEAVRGLARRSAEALPSPQASAAIAMVEKIASAHWEEWHRQAKVVELKMAAKYGHLYGSNIRRNYYFTWSNAGRIDGREDVLSQARDKSINPAEKRAVSQLYEALIVVRAPSFLNLEQDTGFLNLVAADREDPEKAAEVPALRGGQQMPQLGDEKLPAGLLTDTEMGLTDMSRQYLQSRERLRELTSLESRFIDPTSTLKWSLARLEALQRGGNLAVSEYERLKGELEQALKELSLQETERSGSRSEMRLESTGSDHLPDFASPSWIERHNRRMSDLADSDMWGFYLDAHQDLQTLRVPRAGKWFLQEEFMLMRATGSDRDPDLYTQGHVPVPFETLPDGRRVPAIYEQVQVEGRHIVRRLELSEIESRLRLAPVTGPEGAAVTLKGFMRRSGAGVARVLTLPGPFDIYYGPDGQMIHTVADLERLDPGATSELAGEKNSDRYREMLIRTLIERGKMSVRTSVALEFKGIGSQFETYQHTRDDRDPTYAALDKRNVIILGALGVFGEGFGVAGWEEALALKVRQPLLRSQGVELNDEIVAAYQIAEPEGAPVMDGIKKGSYMSVRFGLSGTSLRLDEVSADSVIAMRKAAEPEGNVLPDNVQILEDYLMNLAIRFGADAGRLMRAGLSMTGGGNDADNYDGFGRIADSGTLNTKPDPDYTTTMKVMMLGKWSQFKYAINDQSRSRDIKANMVRAFDRAFANPDVEAHALGGTRREMRASNLFADRMPMPRGPRGQQQVTGSMSRRGFILKAGVGIGAAAFASFVASRFLLPDRSSLTASPDEIRYQEILERTPPVTMVSAPMTYSEYLRAREASAALVAQAVRFAAAPEVQRAGVVSGVIAEGIAGRWEVVIVPRGKMPADVPATIDLESGVTFVNPEYLEEVSLRKKSVTERDRVIRLAEVIAHEWDHKMAYDQTGGHSIYDANGDYDFKSHLKDELRVYDNTTLEMMRAFPAAYTPEQIAETEWMVANAKPEVANPKAIARITGQELGRQEMRALQGRSESRALDPYQILDLDHAQMARWLGDSAANQTAIERHVFAHYLDKMHDYYMNGMTAEEVPGFFDIHDAVAAWTDFGLRNQIVSALQTQNSIDLTQILEPDERIDRWLDIAAGVLGPEGGPNLDRLTGKLKGDDPEQDRLRRERLVSAVIAYTGHVVRTQMPSYRQSKLLLGIVLGHIRKAFRAGELPEGTRSLLYDLFDRFFIHSDSRIQPLGPQWAEFLTNVRITDFEVLLRGLRQQAASAQPKTPPSDKSKRALLKVSSMFQFVGDTTEALRLLERGDASAVIGLLERLDVMDPSMMSRTELVSLLDSVGQAAARNRIPGAVAGELLEYLEGNEIVVVGIQNVLVGERVRLSREDFMRAGELSNFFDLSMPYFAMLAALIECRGEMRTAVRTDPAGLGDPPFVMDERIPLGPLMDALDEGGLQEVFEAIARPEQRMAERVTAFFSEDLGLAFMAPLSRAENSAEILDQVMSEEYKQQAIAKLQSQIGKGMMSESDVDQLVTRILSLLVLGGAEALNGAIKGGLAMLQTPLDSAAKQAVLELNDRLDRALADLAHGPDAPKITLLTNMVSDPEFMSMILDGSSSIPILRMLMFAEDGRVDASFRKVPGLTVARDMNKLRSLMTRGNVLDELRVALPTGGILLTEGTGLGIFSILLDHAQVQGIQDRDLKRLAVKSVFYALMKYASLDEATRKNIDANPAALLPQIEMAGVTFIGLSGNHLALQMAQLAAFIEQVRAVKAAA